MLSWERRHLPDELFYHKHEGVGEAQEIPTDILLLESAQGPGSSDGLLLESSPPFGFDFLLLETAPD